MASTTATPEACSGVRASLGLWRRLRDQARAQTARAHSRASLHARQHRPHAHQVRVEAPVRDVVGVADAVPELWALATDLATLSHRILLRARRGPRFENADFRGRASAGQASIGALASPALDRLRAASDTEWQFIHQVPRMSRRRSDDKRSRILAAAVKVFARKGYFAAKVSEIARRATVADGTIYLYFRNKEDILVSLFDEIMAEHITEARREVDAARGPAHKLRALAERHLRLLGNNRDLAVVFQVELRQSTKFMERFAASWLQDYFALLDHAVEEGQRDGSLRPELPRKLVTRAFFGALDEMVTSWILAKKDYDLAQWALPLVDLFLHGMAVSRQSVSAASTPAASLAGGE
jgi:TetR/AcrR family fatty acid metabolism transcriptional regulator